MTIRIRKQQLVAAIVLLLLGHAACSNMLDEKQNTGTHNYETGDQVSYSADDVSFVMVYVEGGYTFPRGVDDNGDIDDNGDQDVSPTANVPNAYWIAETEVTYELWYKVYTWATTGSGAPGAGQYSFTFGADAPRAGNDGIPGSETDSREPVTYVNWRHAVVWCNALTEWYNVHNGSSPDIDCVYFIDPVYSTPIRSANDLGTVTNTTAGTQDMPYIRAVFEGNTDMVNCAAKGFRLLAHSEWELAARYRGTDTVNTVQAVIGSIDFSNPADGIYWTKGNSASGATTYYNDITGDPNFAGKLANDLVAVYKYYFNGSEWVDNGTSSTAEVKSKAGGANSLGLYDMGGNVWEWSFDWYLDGFIVLRGSWCDPSIVMRVGGVQRRMPNEEYNYLGFRFARSE